MAICNAGQHGRVARCLGIFALTMSAAIDAVAQDGVPTADEIVTRCENKYAGDDQTTRLTITNRNKDGSERQTVYVRHLKNYKPDGDVLQKMLLLTESPRDAKGTTFMRWEYPRAAQKVPEQWLYAPQSRILRRVSVRDPGEAFLGTTLTLGDIAIRAPDQDTHKLLGIERNFGGEWYVVESVPREDGALYSRIVNFYTKTVNWDECVKVQAVFYDPRGIQQKTQKLQWQRVNNAWVWSHVEVVNTQNEQVSIFDVTDVQINPGLGEELFTERNLKRGG